MFAHVLKTSEGAKKADIGIATPAIDQRAIPGNGFDPKNFKEPPKTGFNILFNESMGHKQSRIARTAKAARVEKSGDSVIKDPTMAGSMQATLGVR